MEEFKAIALLKAFQTHLGASKESLANDEDDLQTWNEIDEAIAELEALQAPKTCETCKYSGYFSPHDSLECLNNDCNFYSCDVDLGDGCNKHEPKDTL